MQHMKIKEFCEKKKIRQTDLRDMFPKITHKQALQNFARPGYFIREGEPMALGRKTEIIKVSKHDIGEVFLEEIDGKMQLTKVLHTTYIKEKECKSQ